MNNELWELHSSHQYQINNYDLHTWLDSSALIAIIVKHEEISNVSYNYVCKLHFLTSTQTPPTKLSFTKSRSIILRNLMTVRDLMNVHDLTTLE